MKGSGKSLSMTALSSFTGDPEGYVKEGSENEHLSLRRGPTGEAGGSLIYWGL